MPLFPRPYGLIRRGSGAYVDGIWTPAPEPGQATVLADVQPASTADYQRLEAMPGGRRTTNLLRLYCDIQLAVAGDADHPGDLILIDGTRYLVIGRMDRHVLGLQGVSHWRYLLVPEIETVPGEVTA